MTWLYQWATEVAQHGMATVAELEARGFVKVARCGRYGSWLMRRVV